MFLFLSLIPLTKFLFMSLISLTKFSFVSLISLTKSNLAFRRWLALLIDLFPLFIPAKGLKIDLAMSLFASLIPLTKPNLVIRKSDLKLTTGLMIPFLIPRLSFWSPCLVKLISDLEMENDWWNKATKTTNNLENILTWAIAELRMLNLFWTSNFKECLCLGF